MEPIITINGKQLTQGQSMTVRAALNAFTVDLKNEGLGEDEIGLSILKGYLRNIQQINEMIGE